MTQNVQPLKPNQTTLSMFVHINGTLPQQITNTVRNKLSLWHRVVWTLLDLKFNVLVIAKLQKLYCAAGLIYSGDDSVRLLMFFQNKYRIVFQQSNLLLSLFLAIRKNEFPRCLIKDAWYEVILLTTLITNWIELKTRKQKIFKYVFFITISLSCEIVSLLSEPLWLCWNVNIFPIEIDLILKPYYQCSIILC